MNRAERVKRDAEIVALREQNYSMQDIADMFQLSLATVCRVCQDNNVAGKRSNKKARYVAPAIPQQKTEEEAAETVQQKLPAFEYVGNYTGSDGTADIRCKCCGTVITKSWTAIRHSKVKCKVCHDRQMQKIRDKRKAEHDERLRILADQKQQRQRDLFWQKKFDQISMRICPVCRQLFVVTKRRTKYCSNKCGQKVTSSRHKKTRERLLRKVVDNDITLQGLYSRDKGVCYICGDNCDWNDSYYSDGIFYAGNSYPSIDHIVPISKGGLHAWENIKLAHRHCNSKKSAHIIPPQ